VIIDLRDYQEKSVEDLREGFRGGHQSQILVAPTGSGKTVTASHLLGEAQKKSSRAFFVCDRVALVDQTSTTLDRYGIQHGVMQADHWRARPWEHIQVVSAQTLARRKIEDMPKLLLWDECHTLYQSVLKFVEGTDIRVIGLTATPFTKGMDKIFTNVVNSTTTNRLIEQGWLVPLKAYAAKEIDMTDAEVKFDGEWKDADMEKRAIQIVGDVVEEWIQKSSQYFGGPAKTIAFSATVAHGEELCRQFQARGFNFQQISYKDGNNDRRRELIEEFRKADSEIVGLISCEALAKGFDVTDIKIGIGARPYRKSLSGHIQQLGRVMRSHPGKEFALWLDHAGNMMRFMEDTQEVFENGISELNSGALDAKLRKEKTPEEKKDSKCHSCGFIHTQKICPACGAERPVRRSTVEERAGQLSELDMKMKAKNNWQKDKKLVWKEICHIATDIKGGDRFGAEKFALAQYRNLYGTWPKAAYHIDLNVVPREVVRNNVRRMLIAYRHRIAKKSFTKLADG
jgi:DNA repair protein RadD